MRKNMFDGVKVKDILANRGLTIVDLANKISMDRPLLSKYLNNNRVPKRIVIQRIATALNLNISEISDCSDDDIQELEVAPLTIADDEAINTILNKTKVELTKQANEKSQLDVAKRLGVSGSYVSNIISSDAKIDTFPLVAFLKLFPNMTIDFNEIEPDSDLKDRLCNFINGLNDNELTQAKNILTAVFNKEI